MQLSHATEIQLLYPQEPEWQDVLDPVLIELVQTYVQEPSCATIALGLLHSRGNAEAHTLAQWLLTEDGADQWLKAAATDVFGQSHA